MPRRRVASRRIGVTLGVVGITVLGIAVAQLLVAPRDMRGMPVQFDFGALPSRAEVRQMAVADTGGRLEVPSVGLDVPLGAIDAVDGKIDPPAFTSAYWIRNLGVSPEHAGSGTVYVAMHSLRGGATGPGNYLIDVAHQTSRVHNGDEVRLDGVGYSIDGFEVIPKSEIGTRGDLHSAAPGRLVLITCLQNRFNTPSKNVVLISATKIQSSAGSSHE